MKFGDIVATAYEATSGTSTPPAAAVDGSRCARCSSPSGRMTAVQDVVSNRFTGYHSWINPRGDGLCEPCTWGYRHRPLRTEVHLVHRDRPKLETLTDAQLAAALASPIPADIAVIVPARSGRKHVFPDAEWGHVAAADANLTWRRRDADVLAAMTRLRAAGFTEANLAAPAPPFTIVQALHPTDLPAVLADWATLDPWRSAPPWWHLGLRASSHATRRRK